MSGTFTRHFAVLNINGEHLVYRRARSTGSFVGPAEETIIFVEENGSAAARDDENGTIEQENEINNEREENDELNNSSIIFVGNDEPNNLSDSVIYNGTFQLKCEQDELDCEPNHAGQMIASSNIDCPVVELNSTEVETSAEMEFEQSKQN